MKALSVARGRIGKRGTLVIASKLRDEYGLEDGQDVIQEPTPDGILIRPAISVPVRRYTDGDKAMFLLNNACSRNEYNQARDSVRKMGLDPDKIKHRPWK
jgi:bifunctional DNA-binding transcriptional regulator/antitoxin component of YhaV-PrlF toxin-antitoxin module